MNIKVKTSKSVEFDTFKKEIKTMVKVSGTITAKGVNIHAKLSSDNNDYISLTDIARYRDAEIHVSSSKTGCVTETRWLFSASGSRSTTQRSIALHLMISWTRPD